MSEEVVPGTVIDSRYRIVEVVGIGGMGVVHRGWDLRLNRTVAVKVLTRDIPDLDHQRTRFLREITALASLDSPHVLAALDWGEHNGTHYFVTPYVAGGDLEALLRSRGALDTEVSIGVVCQLAEALHDAHRQGIIHRDVKPSNVLVRDPQAERIFVYLCDFGVAKTMEPSTRTNTGIVLGTWAYMAPECLRGDPATFQSDIYSLGCVLWSCLTGHAPYSGTGPELAVSHFQAPPPQLSGDGPWVGRMNRVLATAMAKDPSQRYGTAEAFAVALGELGRGPAKVRGVADGGANSATTLVRERALPRSPTAPPEPPARRDIPTWAPWVAAGAAMILLGLLVGWAVRTVYPSDADGDHTTSSTTTVSASEVGSFCATATGDGPSVGLLAGPGGLRDTALTDSAYAGVERAVDELDATCEGVQSTVVEGPAKLRELAQSGRDPILVVGPGFTPAVDTVALEFPQTHFAVLDGGDPAVAQPNVAYMSFARNEGSFLVGVAAALKTQAHHVGFVGGVRNPLIEQFEAGYVAGVHAVDPSIRVDVKYVEESNKSGFTNQLGAQKAAASEYDNGADIVYHVAGVAGLGVFEAAVAADRWAIGVGGDQYLSAPREEQRHILTSMVKNVDVATFDMIKSVADGDPLTGPQLFDLSRNGVSYSTSGDYVADIAPTIDSYADKIAEGQIVVPVRPIRPSRP